MATSPKKPSSDGAETKKPAAKKGSTKKAPAKKTVAKKSAVKKPSVKNTAVKKTSPKKAPGVASKKPTPSKAKPEGVKAKSTHTNSQSYSKTPPSSGGDAIAEKLWRLVGMVAFALIGHFTLIALLTLSAMQYVVTFISNEPNDELRNFMGRLTKYFTEIFDYMSFRSDEMPFPFKEFPDGR